MHPIIRLVNRNLTISLNPGFLIWQIIFPLIYIFVAGFAYGPLINAVPFGGKDLDYPAFLASGMIGFNIMNSTSNFWYSLFGMIENMECLNKLCLVHLLGVTIFLVISAL